MDITMRVVGFLCAILGAVLLAQCYYDAENANALVAAFGAAGVAFGFYGVVVSD